MEGILPVVMALVVLESRPNFFAQEQYVMNLEVILILVFALLAVLAVFVGIFAFEAWLRGHFAQEYHVYSIVNLVCGAGSLALLLAVADPAMPPYVSNGLAAVGIACLLILAVSNLFGGGPVWGTLIIPFQVVVGAFAVFTAVSLYNKIFGRNDA